MITEKITQHIEKIIRPVAQPVSRWLLHPNRLRPTWHYETAVVACILIITAVYTSPLPQENLKLFLINWISVGAVLGTFLHAKVGYRMSEAMEALEVSETLCYKYSGRYWVSKELLWFFVFLLSGAYPAIIGNIVFIFYPAWRNIHVKERQKIRG